MKIIVSHLMVEQKQVKFPKKKNNHRWQKKYRKKYSVTVPRQDVLVSETTRIIVCHPAIAQQVRLILEKQYNLER